MHTKTRGQKSATIHAFKALTGEGPGVFEAVVSVFGNVDFGGDRIKAGAFAKSLDRWAESGDPIPVIFSHQWDELGSHLGVVLEAKELLPGDAGLPVEIRDLGGLWCKMRLDVEDATEPNYAPRVWKLLERRSLKEFSFAYDTIDAARGADGVLDLLELDVIEVGPTLKGMNGLTQLLSRKSVEAFLSKAWLDLTGSAEELRNAAFAAAEEWARDENIGAGGFYACYLEATYPDRVVVLVEGWDDPVGEGAYYELDLEFTDGTAALSNGREVEIVGNVTTRPLVAAEIGTVGMAARVKALATAARAKSTTAVAPTPTVPANGDDTTDDNPEPGNGNGEDLPEESESGTGEAARALLELDILELS